MKKTPTIFKDAFILEPVVHKDNRGFFYESFKSNYFKNTLNIDIDFCQENESLSYKNVFRGLHFQKNPFAQSKLVRVIKGSVLDIIVDLRRDSNTFLKSEIFELSSENRRQLFVPKGFAHGFHTISDYAILSYKVDNYFTPEYDSGINVQDPNLKINFNFSSMIFSNKDLLLPNFNESMELF